MTVEIPEVFSLRDLYITQPGDSVEVIATKLGIRLAGMPEGIGSIQPGDRFELQIGNMGTVSLIKRRPKTTPGTKLEALFKIEATKVYQDTEKGPPGFPYVSFKRNPEKNTYTMLDSQGRPSGIVIPTAKLEDFKKELATISPKLIAECGARRAQTELACSIESVNGLKETAFKLNDRWYKGFFDKHHVDMTRLYSLTANSRVGPTPYLILKELISSLPGPVQIAPTQTAKK